MYQYFCLIRPVISVVVLYILTFYYMENKHLKNTYIHTYSFIRMWGWVNSERILTFIFYYPFKGSYRHFLYNIYLMYDLWNLLLPLKCVKKILAIKITFSELRSLGMTGCWMVEWWRWHTEKQNYNYHCLFQKHRHSTRPDNKFANVFFIAQYNIFMLLNWNIALSTLHETLKSALWESMSFSIMW